MLALLQFQNSVTDYQSYYEAPVLLQGVEEYNILCPVSPKTGHRMNIIDLLSSSLSDKHQRLLGQILQEVPTIRSMDVSDDDKLNLLASRFATGTPAENDKLRQDLESVVSVLFPEKSDVQKQVIDFTDTSTKDVVENTDSNE